MLEQLLLHIERHQLCKTTDKILLAVSGGVDSMVMLELFVKAGIPVGVAHCNFQLRGSDSIEDEEFVSQRCKKGNIPFFTERFDTVEFAGHHGLSIQLAARKLRYDFFETIRAQNGYDWIATAHNLNDSLETVLLNLARGTGLQGLAGIPGKNGFVIRPLQFASRDEVIRHAKAQGIAWREDASNAEDDYQRNFLRHHVIPRLKEINSSLEQTFEKTLERISGAVDMTMAFLQHFRTSSVSQHDDALYININDLYQHTSPQVILWELIKEFGFNYDQCRDVIGTTQSGKQFYSSTHSLTVDREALIISPVKDSALPEILIEAGQLFATNGDVSLSIEKKSNTISIDKLPTVAQVDASLVSFPLRWRKWKAGDIFRPLGMNSHKKISDLLIDLKVPAPEKEKVTVIESAGKIVWVVGHRVSDEFKITTSTTASLRLKVQKLDPEKIS